MLCPKCGTEYEGSKCPVCSKPEIVVNNADYLKRKKAYEEKQADSKSASSDTKNRHEKQPEMRQQTIAQDKTSQILQSGVTFVAEKGRQIRAHIGKRDKTAVNKNADATSDMKKLASIRKKGFSKKKILIGVTAILIVLAAIGVYHLAIRKNYEMYMVSENGIYNVSSLEYRMVCDTKDAVFAADNRTFYRISYPQQVAKDEVIDLAVSTDGKYFAVVTYDETKHIYDLYLWNKNGVVEVASSTKRKDIKYLSNQGKLIYTDMTENQSRDATTNTAESNVAGGVSNVTLYVYEVTDSDAQQIQGVQHLIDNNILSVHIYTQKNTLICLNGDNSLYLYNYEKLSEKTGIADDVSGIYAMSEDTENLYTYNAAEVNLKKSAVGFVYTIGQNCFYHEITEKETMKTIDSKNTSDLVLAKASGSSMQVIYEKSNNLVYIMNSGKITYAKIEDKKVGKFEEAAAFGAMTTGLYFPDESTYLFIDDQNRLVSLKKGETHTLIEDVTDGMLYRVENTNTAFTYVKSGKRYYRTDFSGKDIELINVADGYASGKIIWYKNNLYFYKEDGRLYTCTQKGKNLTEVGDVERFFLGTEYH